LFKLYRDTALYADNYLAKVSPRSKVISNYTENFIVRPKIIIVLFPALKAKKLGKVGWKNFFFINFFYFIFIKFNDKVHFKHKFTRLIYKTVLFLMMN
jgi:hypothetical protein